MIGSVFIYQRVIKDFIFCQFIKIWVLIFVHPKVVASLKNGRYYPVKVMAA